MILRPINPRSWLAAVSFVVTAVALCLALGGTFLVFSSPAVGMQQARNGGEPVSGTPVATTAEVHDPLDSDPSQGAPSAGDLLDGDPLDGLPAGDPSAPVDQTQLEVVRSARPHDEPPSVAVYDDDLQTAWTPQTDASETWLWLDLGLESTVREVRVLSRGRGTIDVAVSSDRRVWRDVDRIDAGGGWQGLELREDARYVRLTLLSADDDGGELPAIAEAAVYGPDRRRSVSSEQRAGEARERDRDRQSRGNGESAAEQKAADDASSGGTEERREPRSGGQVRISAKPGETRCSGKSERCEARQGEVSVEEDCEREGTCTIDVRADGGTAVCDAAGGDETNAGNGNGRRGGEAGRCEAVANGGAVAIGDVNP